MINMKRFLKKGVIILLLLFSVVFNGHVFANQYEDRPIVVGTNGMVASICPMAAEAGLEILRMGGNAFDAFVAITAVQSVTNPANLSAGGGGWANMYVKNENKIVCLDYMGRIPHAATAEMFAGLDDPWHGYLPSLVPGNIGGWYELHRRYGSLPLEQVWARAIDYAENGFPASKDHVYSLSVNTAMMEYPSSAAVYFPDKRVPDMGEICYNKDLANTYRMVIENGIDWFYKGEGAEKIVAHYEKTGGLITKRDLEEFTADWWEPASANYKGYDFFVPPPEASNAGIITLEALKIIEGFDLKEWGRNSVNYIHHFVEAFKLADADYYQLCIPEERGGGPIPVEWLLSEEHIVAQRERIDPTHASAIPSTDRYLATESAIPSISYILEQGKEGGTCTLSVVVADKYGNLISGIQSTGLWFGTRVVVEGMGFTATSMIQFCDRNPDYVWAIKGGLKVPITIVPIIIMKDGKPWVGMGSGGTETIFQCPVQIIINMLEFGMNPQAAIEAPRFAAKGTWADPPGQPGKFEIHRNNQMYLEIFPPVTYETAMQLANKGHYILPVTQKAGFGTGGYSMIVIDPKTGTFFGMGDPRLPSYAVGW